MPATLPAKFGRTWGKIHTSLRWVLFNSQSWSRIRHKHHVLCLGDSHVRVFTNVGRLFPDHLFYIRDVPGATAQGMVNPESRTNALQIFRDLIGRARGFQDLVIMLGEVDCGFVIWYRAGKYGISIEDQLDDSLRAYEKFLTEAQLRGFPRITVVAAPPPTIRDEQDWGEVAHLRSSVSATRRERTDLTLEYNERLGEICRAHGFDWIDVTSLLLDPATNLVREELMNANTLDHHLDQDAYAALLSESFAPPTMGNDPTR